MNMNLLIAFLLLNLSLIQGALFQGDINALRAFYTSLTSTGSLQWDFTTDLCSQEGITCDANQPQRVIKLDVSYLQLTGTISSQLGTLSKLQDLELHDNNLKGPIPTQLAKLSELQILHLAYNQLTGEVHTQLSTLSKLTKLFLNNNQLTGKIPAKLSQLSQLQYLSLYNNKLTGTIPTQLGALSQLVSLNLDNNQFTGTIPTNLASLSQLSWLFLNNNKLTGTIPTQLDNLSQLQVIYLASNFFNCPIPAYNYWTFMYSDYNIASSQCSNSCPSDQCLNGGKCSIAGNQYNSFKCACVHGTSGNHCQVSACDTYECKNGGSCTLNSSGNPKCLCPQGCGGAHCETCNSPNTSSCTCPIQFRGPTCASPNPLAASVTPLAYYSFTSSNKLSDGTGNGHNLSPFKTQSINYPLNYDPSNDALVFFGQDIVATSSPSINLGTSFSVSVVFSISNFYLTSTLVQFTPNDMSSVSPLNILVLSSGAIQISANGIVVLKTANSIISLNTPYLITLVKNGNTLRLYKNGISVGTKSTSIPININKNNMYLAYNFIGVLDEVAIYSSALTPAQITNQNTLLSLPTSSCSGCLNGGICGKLNAGKTCFCSQCFSGNTCSTKTSGCNNPCLNGGMNVDGTCQCAAGYDGTTCASVVKCPAINDPTGNFQASNAYKGAVGTCPSGNGSPKRQCLSDGTWRDVSSPCT